MEQTLTAPATQAPDEATAAFEELYRESRDDLFAYVSGMLHDRSAAEDVTALAFERAFRRRRRFNPRKGTRRAWLFGIARNAALDELRRRRHAELADEVLDPRGGRPLGVGRRRPAPRRPARRRWRLLSARERELVALKFFAGLANAEIASVIGVSESNAGTRLHRVIEKLRSACDEPA